ncbi:Dormancy-associated protein homolog 3-like [Cicer arietinum]|uniref:Dormancy-associated protein homolog 3-like n=1 Tax=Cicer arietinum TaxID=3827 RepID=A0A067XN86_CICAR|nr:Dormancy-associated protein homolog 3-like [Cicer arietinum]AGP25718.1 hypothetical protein [Cicer arietinum]
MDLLDHLWDDTVAGPRPENGLVKLRKHPTFPNSPSISAKEAEGGNVRSYGGGTAEEGMRVTRSIMIVKPAGYQSQSGSAPASPAGSTPPVSPFSGGREGFRFGRRSTSSAYENEKAGQNRRSPSSPFDV